jgi:hypothetical protein
MYQMIVEKDPRFAGMTVSELMVDFVEGKDDTYRSVLFTVEDADILELKKEIQESWAKIQNPEFWKTLL